MAIMQIAAKVQEEQDSDEEMGDQLKLAIGRVPKDLQNALSYSLKASLFFKIRIEAKVKND